MSNTNNGGPAFQHTCREPHGDSANDVHYPGVSIRDYFAAKALAGILANDNAMQQLMAKSDSGNLDRSARDCVADMTYRYADAMLKAREAK